MTQVMKASQARQQWSQLLNKVYKSQDRIVIEKSGIPIAAVISASDLERITTLEDQWDEDFAILDKIARKFQDIPTKEIEREVNKALSEVRAENRKSSNNPKTV